MVLTFIILAILTVFSIAYFFASNEAHQSTIDKLKAENSTIEERANQAVNESIERITSVRKWL